jgi:hypothetical protein
MGFLAKKFEEYVLDGSICFLKNSGTSGFMLPEIELSSLF